MEFIICYLLIGWACSAVTCVIGAYAFLKAERERLRRFDCMVYLAWCKVEREINPPPQPDVNYLNAFAQQVSPAMNKLGAQALLQGGPNSGYANAQLQHQAGRLFGGAPYGLSRAGLGLFGF